MRQALTWHKALDKAVDIASETVKTWKEYIYPAFINEFKSYENAVVRRKEIFEVIHERVAKTTNGIGLLALSKVTLASK
jgi:hypothetical protein